MGRKSQKIEKEFILSDSSVNSYGFRLLTSGYQLEEYKKNPIGFLMHNRDNGVKLRWEDLTVEGDVVKGKPVINLGDSDAQKIIDDIEEGFLNAASVGHIVVLELSHEETKKLPGQPGPTITKWFNRECSLVDIPGNFNALKLFDAKENEIAIADLMADPDVLTKPKNKSMSELKLTAATLAALTLQADPSATELERAILELKARADKTVPLAQELSALKATQAREKVETLISGALAARKITKEMGDKLTAMYAEKPDQLKDLIDTMPVYAPLTSQIGSSGSEEEHKQLSSKTFDQLMESGEMGTVKEKYPDLYLSKCKEAGINIAK